MGGGRAETARPAMIPERTRASMVGLCESCRNVRTIETRTGSRFFLCQLSAFDPAFPRYPRLPVLRCRGYEPEEEASLPG